MSLYYWLNIQWKGKLDKVYKVHYASFYFKDSSQGECPQMIADTRPLSEVLQPVMTCNSEHATGIPDLYTAQPCNAQKVIKLMF